MKVALRRHLKFRSIKFVNRFNEIEKLFFDVSKNLRILNLESETRKLGRQILNLLGPSHGLLFFEYERSVYLAESFCIERAYRLGIKAGKEREK